MDELIRIGISGNSRIDEGAERILAAAQKGEECYKDSLGWLDPSKWAGEEWVERSIQLARKASAIADTFVVIGIGGSNNSVRALLGAVGRKSGMNVVYAGNTLSSYAYRELIESLEGHDFVIDCIAKNFETLEPGVAFRVLRDLLVKRYGKAGASERIFCTGTPGSYFESLAAKEGYAFIPFPEDIGGRYTALSPVHLVPMAAGGADIRELARGAADMAHILRTSPAKENSALLYALARNRFYDEGYRIEMLDIDESTGAFTFGGMECFSPQSGWVSSDDPRLHKRLRTLFIYGYTKPLPADTFNGIRMEKAPKRTDILWYPPESFLKTESGIVETLGKQYREFASDYEVLRELNLRDLTEDIDENIFKRF